MGLLCTRARVRLAQGKTHDAVEDFKRVLRAEPPSSGLRLPPSIECRPSAALGLLALGEPERAHVLANEELDRARAFGAPRALGVALRVAGIVERDIVMLEESVATLEPSPARLEYARSLVELGAALRRANQRAAARDQLSAGMELAYQCGAAPVADRALEELRAAGARPRRIMRSGVDSLTASELRIARLAADGRTNAEIAQELYISLKTVEMHLSRAYSKLDLSGKAGRRRLAQTLAAQPTNQE
jgi:DNA-binding CsgD family transcriptional regulator